MTQVSKQDLAEFKRITKEMRGLEFPNDEVAMRAAQGLIRLFEKAPSHLQDGRIEKRS